MPLERRVRQKLAHKKSLLAPVRLGASLSELFHENSKLGPLTGRAHAAAIQSFLSSRRTQELMTRAYKSYTLAERVELPTLAPESGLERGIAARRSGRSYSGEAVALEELARLLFFSYGKTGPEGFFRAAGSGGGLYPLELYVVPRCVTGLDAGIYHYNVEDHCLEAVAPGERWQAVADELSLGGVDADHLAAAVIVTAVFRRSTLKYGDRGYRLLLMEAGAVAHNLCLLATSLGLGACQIGSFHDDRLSELLGLDGVEEAPIVPVVFGRAGSTGG